MTRGANASRRCASRPITDAAIANTANAATIEKTTVIQLMEPIAKIAQPPTD